MYRAGIVSPVDVPHATWIYFLVGRTEIHWALYFLCRP